MILNKKIIIVFLFFLISACASVPKNTADGCSIFSERYLWYKHAKKAEQKWGTPIYLQLAIIKMESDFDWLAKPPRQKLFKVVPYKRLSSSLGYSQAIKGTWKQYKQETGNKQAINSPQEQDLRTVLILLVGIQIKLKKFLKFLKKMPLGNILLITKDGEIIKIINKNKRLYCLQKKLKINLTNIKVNLPNAAIH